MIYHGIDLKSSISIEKIYSIHYFEYWSDFTFPGESHDFWEFICVDKGEVNIQSGTRTINLKKGEIFFHEPNEFHSVHATHGIAPNLVVISFRCNSEAMEHFRKRLFKIDETERHLLADIIAEARHFFDCRLDDPYLPNPPLKEADVFGAEQMTRLYLEHFLIHIIRRILNKNSTRKEVSKRHFAPSKMTKAKSDQETFNRVVAYLESNLQTHITIEQICKDNMIGRSQLQKIFKAQTAMGIIEYFSSMKINTAKELIRTNRMNFTQISEHLGYSSIHYFSRQFKKITGMTPSEYASSIKAVADGNL